MTDDKDKKIAELDAKLKEVENTLSGKETQIKDLEAKRLEKENALTAKETQFKELEAKKLEIENTLTGKENQIKDLEAKKLEIENTLNSKVKEFEQLDLKLKEKEKEITEKDKVIEDNNNKIKEKEDENKKLKEEYENKIKELDEKIAKMENEIKNNEAVKELTKENEKLKSENEQLNNILIPPFNTDIKNSYDICLNFNSIKSIKEGWDLNLSELGLQNFNKNIRCQKIGIIGNKGVGKSFILSCLFGLPFSQLNENYQEKISIKLLVQEEKKGTKVNFMIFDCQGFDNPILEEKSNNEDNIDDINELNNEEEKKEENNKNIEKNNNTANKNINLTNSGSIMDLENCEEIKKYERLEELKTNNYLIEELITRFMIEYSDVLIFVLNNMKYSEQLLLEKIIKECIKYKKDSLYVIHNLKNLVTKEQVDNYINNILLKSGTFNLEEKQLKKFPSKNKEINEEKNYSPSYYIMKYDSLTVNHFIYINDICNEKSYNNFTNETIANYINYSHETNFNISKKLHKTIYDILKDYSKNEIKEEDIKFEENESKNGSKKIIYKGSEEIKLKKFKNVNNIKNEVKLKYSYYPLINEEEKKLYILIERPGEISDQHIYGRKDNMKYNIKYTGKKSLSEEEKNQKDNIKIVGREFGEFVLDIDINMKDYEISNIEKPEFTEKNGIGYIVYDLKNISNLDFVIGKEQKKELNNQ